MLTLLYLNVLWLTSVWKLPVELRKVEVGVGWVVEGGDDAGRAVPGDQAPEPELVTETLGLDSRP